MPPTYSTNEAFNLMYELDFEGLLILGEVIEMDRKRYSLDDLQFLTNAYVIAYQLAVMD